VSKIINNRINVFIYYIIVRDDIAPPLLVGKDAVNNLAAVRYNYLLKFAPPPIVIFLNFHACFNSQIFIPKLVVAFLQIPVRRYSY